MKIKCPKNKIFEVDKKQAIMQCSITCIKENKCNLRMFRPEEVVEEATSPATVRPIGHSVSNTQIASPSVNQEPQKKPSKLLDIIGRFGGNTNDAVERKPVVTFDPNEELIRIGAKVYKVKDINIAIMEIFMHWDTYSVFKNKKEFTPAFKKLLMVKYSEKYQEVIDDVFREDSTINSLFYKLYYKHLYAKTSVVEKFYFANEYQRTPLVSIIQQPSDLYIQISNNFNYMNRLSSCMKELLDFLHISNEEQLYSEAVKYDTNRNEYYKYVLLDKSSENFINNLSNLDTLDIMRSKLKFLKYYDILDNGIFVDRVKPLEEKDMNYTIDNSVYDILGITNYNSSQSRDVLKTYLTLLNEYIKIEKPKELVFPHVKLDENKFYNQILAIIHDAYSKLVDPKYKNHIDMQRLYLLYVLKHYGILDIYISKCTNRELELLLELIDTRLEYSNYYKCEAIQTKYVYFEGESRTIEQYFDKLVDSVESDQIVNVMKQDELFKLVSNSIVEKESQIISRINSEVKKL